MSTETFAEYVGLTADAVAAIESHRSSPTETKSEILIRVLKPAEKAPPAGRGKAVDYGEGITLYTGDELYLFLSKAGDITQPDARAALRPDGFYMNGKKIGPLGKRLFDRVMKGVQDKKGHRNEKGEIISLSSMRQWHVVRNGKLTPLTELKDPALARKRTRSKVNLTLEDLGL